MLDSIFLLLAVTALVGCTTTTVIYPSTTDVESVSLPAANELLVAACAPLAQASVLPTDGGQQCGFWLIDPLMQQMTMLAQLEAVASNENAVYWLAEGSRFLFQQRAVASVTNYHNPFAFFDGHGFSVKMADLSGGVVVSPDGQYFVSLTCRTANLNPGSRFVLYSAETGSEICAVLTGAASMTGCQDDEYARAACTAPLSDGSTWVLSATSTTTIGAQICRNDGACASQNLYEAPPRVYESWRYVAVTVADRIVIYDKQAAHFQIFAVPSDYSIVASAWSPSTP